MSTAAPSSASLDSIIAQLQETGLVPPEQLAPFIPPAATPTDAQAWTAELAGRGLLTKFQASQVAAGKAKSLVIGAYAMLDRVSGGGGLLFKGLHRRMQRVVFIKPLPPSLMKTAAPRVQRDVAAAGRLAHPNLVAVQDLDEVGGAHFLVTEFVDGADLATVAQQGKFAIDKGCGLVAQAAEALTYLHSQGVVHRDVKIDNLFIERGGAVKLFGLGIAPVDTGDAAGDVAALGRVLYRLVAGVELPVGAIPALKATRPEVSPALEKFCLRMLSATPTERPSASEVAAAMKSPELTAPVPVVDASQSMFPELFVDAEEEAPTVMSAPFDPAALPPLNPPPQNLPSNMPAAAMPQPAAPVEISTPTVVTPAPLAPAPFAPTPYVPTPNVPPAANTPNLPLSPNMPPPMMVPGAVAPAMPPTPEFAVNPAPAFAVSTAPPAMMVPAANPMEPAAVVVEVGDPDVGLAVATIEPAPMGGAFGVESSFNSAAATATASTAATKKAARPRKPIDLPFNLQLDPKYLEPKYVAGAAGGVILLLVLMLWALTGGGKTAPVKAVPAIPVVRGPRPLSPAQITPGTFQLPPSGGAAARNQPGATFDEFGFQNQATPAAPTRPRR